MEMIGVARFSYAFQILVAPPNTANVGRQSNGSGHIWRRDVPSRSAAVLASRRRNPVMSPITATPGSG